MFGGRVRIQLGKSKHSEGISFAKNITGLSLDLEGFACQRDSP